MLFLSPVWPERSSSAAGVRSCDLIASFQDRNYAVSYASPSTPNEHTSIIQASGVQTFECPPNNEDALAAVLRSARPSIVLFDRFYAEEMYSFRVRDILPDALRILDMQDVHFLREARQLRAKELEKTTIGTSGTPMMEPSTTKTNNILEILNYRPDATFPSLLRELASIYRSDLTLVCSPVELTMLQKDYTISSELLVLAPFFAPPSPHAAAPVPWSERHHYVMIGNFRHPPNFDSVRWTCSEIWPLIRKKLGKTSELHLYGSYAPQAATELHNPKQGIIFKGFAPSLDIMLQYRVCLAPLRYGAGLKGKIVDSWWHGLPVCTTAVGSEGMKSNSIDWGGLDGGSTPEEIANEAIQLYSESQLWEESQSRGFDLLGQLYNAEDHLNSIHSALESAKEELKSRRARGYVGQMLWSQQMRATEYFSRWIELKEKGQEKGKI